MLWLDSTKATIQYLTEKTQPTKEENITMLGLEEGFNIKVRVGEE